MCPKQLRENFGLLAGGKYHPFALEKYNPSLLVQMIEKEATSPFFEAEIEVKIQI